MKLFRKMISDRSKKGFTLVEMLIVIAVLVILMAVAVPNVAGYVKRIKLMELDDSARSIFMAVQNKMTVMKQSGVNLKDLEGRSTYAGDKYPYVFKQDDNTIPPAGASENTKYEDPEPRYLKIVVGEDGHGTDNPLVSVSTIEGQLYNHNYVIEYDATTGRVFGVFYSEESDLSQYPAAYMTKDDIEDSRAFETRLRADKLVGYYGGEGDLMRVPIGGEVEKPTNVTDSTLEKLVFMLDPPKKPDGTYETGKYYFEVTITGKDAKGQEHTIAIVPYDSAHPDKNYYVQNGQRGTVILDSIAPGCGADNGQWYLPSHYNPSDYDMSGYTLERDFKGWVYINEAYKSTFFSDLNNFNDNPSMKNGYDPYIHSINEWNLGKGYVIGSYSNSWQYAQHFRIDPGTDITVTITRYKDGLLDSKTTRSVNSYFDSLDGDCAVIKAGRHLQNLANQPSVDKVKAARLEKDIDFSQDTGNYDSWNSAVTYKGTPAYPYLYNFKPVNLNFAPNRANFSFSGKGKDGTQHIIKYIRIDTVKDPRFNTDPEVQKNTAFFSSFYNTSASDIIFHCPVVIGGGDYTGVFFGQCTGGTNITNYTLVNPIVESSGKYVGGLFGEVTGGGNFSGHKVYVEEVTDYFDNYESDYTKRDTRKNITWDDPLNDPYARFCVNGTGDNTYAGGMVGHTSGTQVKDSAAAIRVESKGYAGGLIGLAESDIIKCHVGGHTYNGWFVVPAGTMCGDMVLSQPDYLINIKGKKASGGFAAKMTSGSIDGGYTTCSVGYYGSNKSLADTFVEGSSMASGSNDAYAIGVRIGVDSHEIDEKGTDLTGTGNFWVSLTDLLDKKESSLAECNVLKKYDKTLQEKYPYRLGNSNLTDSSNQYCHLGDWPIPQTAISGYGLFYWEVEDGAYHIKAVGKFDGKTEASTLCAAMDGKGIINHGYGYFYSSDITDVNHTALGGQDPADENTKNGIISALNSAGLRGVTFKLLNTPGHGDKEINFKVKNAAGTESSTKFYYNPDFCALSTSSLAEYEIRSFNQLKNLSDNSSYWDKNFKLSHDVVFGSTENITPIGVSANPFTGRFDGHLYRIVNAKLTANGSDAGIFGYVNNATINGVVVFNADYTLTNLNSGAAVGGVVGRALGNSSITNCAFTGKIDVSAQGDIAAGGIVGIADGDGIRLHNCQAVLSDGNTADDNPDMMVSGSGILSAGGIAGMYYSSNALENCYSGGYITASGSTQTYIGGIIGTKAGETGNVSIKNCYTYYQTDIGVTANSFPHPIGSADTYSNCFYLGGNWYNIAQIDSNGVTRYDDMDTFLLGTNSLRSQAGFGSADGRSFADSLTGDTFTYVLPAVISENNQYYHYGKSPDETLVSIGDKRFGVFYWEEEAGAYYLKVCYYDKPGESYEYASRDTLCEYKDGHSIARSGYGYFIGKGVKNTGVIGFTGLDELSKGSAEYSGISSSIEKTLGIESGKLADNFKFAFYDCSASNNVSKIDISVRSDIADINSKKFRIIPGLCAITGNDYLKREVRTANHLRNISAAGLSNHYYQTHDIIFTAGSPIALIGNASSPFKGKYDGNCYRILNLEVQSSSGDIGLFGKTEGATITNTFVIDGKVVCTGTISRNAGGIVGMADNTIIENSVFTGSVSANVGSNNSIVVGGIAGYCENGGGITRCESTADINVTGNGGKAKVGGIVGAAFIKVDSCYSGGSVSLSEELQEVTVGGIVGYGHYIDDGANVGADVTNCYTHMYISKMEVGAVSSVNPIGNSMRNISNCHYIESKHHYANAFDEEQSGITKHFAFDINMNGNGFGGAEHTYPAGLSEDNTNPYPMPAVVVDSSAHVHYGRWNDDIVPLNAKAYGIFYWEKEDEEYHLRVRYAEEESEGSFAINSIDSKDFCTEMDGKPITDFGYGYFHSDTITMDEIDFNYKTQFSNDTVITNGINNALKELGFTGITVKWSHGNVDEHGDKTVQLKQNGTSLQVDGKNVYVKFNLDFCYLKMWAGDKNADPNPNEPYEIRNNQQLGNVGISTGNHIKKYYYLDGAFIQTHDINYPGAEGWKLEPIGTKGDAFTGTYNGNGYRIIDARIHNTEQCNYLGLFGYADKATITGVNMFNAMITAPRITVLSVISDPIGAVGGIAGYANDTRVENCAFNGIIDVGVANLALPRCRYAVGGIVGFGAGNSMLIRNCESIVSTSWTDSNWSASYHLSEGGIAGIAYGRIENCYSGGLLEADKGGFITIGEAKVTAGGIAGSGNVSIDRCYSYIKIANNIQFKNPIGNDFAHESLIGTIDYDVTISNCYCLKGTGFYNHDVTDENIIVVNNGNISDFAAALKNILTEPDDLGIRRYNVKAYTDSLSSEGIYPLAAVVKDNSNQYVHYGDVANMIQYKATVVKTGHGIAKASPEYALPGDTVTLTVKPANMNYSIESITIDGKPIELVDGQTEYTFTMPKGNVNVDVKFKSVVRSITTKVASGEGTFSIDYIAKPGDTVKFEVSPKTGWKCSKVTVVDASGASVKVDYTEGDKTGSFIMPDADVTVTATFEEEVTVPEGHHRITVNIIPAGSATVECPEYGKGYIKFKINAAEGYIPQSAMLSNGTSIQVGEYNLEAGFNMPDSDVTLTITLDKKQYNITINHSNNGKVTSKVSKATMGETVTLTVEPNDGYKLSNLTVNNGGVSLYPTVSADNLTYTFTMPNKDVSVSATFEQKPWKIIIDSSAVDCVIIDNNITEQVAGQWVSYKVTSDSKTVFVSTIDGKTPPNNQYWGNGGGFNMPNADVIIKAVPK